MITTVPDISLINGVLLTSDGRGNFMKIHEQQGTMDGACSVYSVTMSLLYENIINYEDVEKPGRSKGARLLKDLITNYGFIKYGFYLKKLSKLLVHIVQKIGVYSIMKELLKNALQEYAKKYQMATLP